MSEAKHPGGRPPLWTDPAVLKKLVDEYFATEKRITLAGLAVYLGCDRSTLADYGKKDKFSSIIKEARGKVEAIYEAILVHNNAMGPIFPLKNMGWSDNRHIDHTTAGKELPQPIYNGVSK